MEKDFRTVTDEQVIKKTGRKISKWKKILDEFQASKKGLNDIVTHLHREYGALMFRARVLTTYYFKQMK